MGERHARHPRDVAHRGGGGEPDRRFAKAQTIGAQAHLEAFYNRHGFVSDNKPYIEDGIPHLEMIRA